MVHKLSLFLSVFTFFLVSCNNEDESQMFNEVNEIQTMSIAGKQILQIDGTLVFESEGELKEVADDLIPLIHTKSSDGLLKADYSNVAKLKEKGFTSLYDVFERAMNDVDEYYSRPGGYEEFKAKYSSLFFPEEGDDYSAYLPISNKKLAMLADVNGDVMIAKTKVSLKDITTYQQLVDLGQTPPGDIVTMAEKGDVITGTNKIPETKVGSNKVWVNTKRGMDGMIPIIQVEVCFRKKYGFIWSNHNSNTTAYLQGGFNGLQMYVGKDHESATAIHGFSSHDYYYANPVTPGTGFTVPVKQLIRITHGGTGLTLDLTCDYPSILP